MFVEVGPIFWGSEGIRNSLKKPGQISLAILKSPLNFSNFTRNHLHLTIPCTAAS